MSDTEDTLFEIKALAFAISAVGSAPHSLDQADARNHLMHLVHLIDAAAERAMRPVRSAS